MNEQKMKFPEDFLFDVATSAAQVEGGMRDDGRGLSIWDVFSRIPGAIADNSRADIVPNTTLYHWDLPYELEREGGWLDREVSRPEEEARRLDGRQTIMSFWLTGKEWSVSARKI